MDKHPEGSLSHPIVDGRPARSEADLETREHQTVPHHPGEELSVGDSRVFRKVEALAKADLEYIVNPPEFGSAEYAAYSDDHRRHLAEFNHACAEAGLTETEKEVLDRSHGLLKSGKKSSITELSGEFQLTVSGVGDTLRSASAKLAQTDWIK